MLLLVPMNAVGSKEDMTAIYRLNDDIFLLLQMTALQIQITIEHSVRQYYANDGTKWVL